MACFRTDLIARRSRIDPRDADVSAGIARRKSHVTSPALTAEDHRAAEAAVQRRAYDDALAAGGTPAPEDFTGWRIGTITVTGPAQEPGRWTVRNPDAIAGVSETYTISRETLLACHAAGDLTPPSPGP